VAVPVLHRDTHHARQAPDGEPMRELDQIQQQTFHTASGDGAPAEPVATT
jgi:hypothetical protein